jgi:isocitrate lyase
MLSVRRTPHNKESLVAKKRKKTKKAKRVRRLYTKEDIKNLRAHSKAKTPVARIAKLMKRSEATLRQKAVTMGIPLGHRR